MGMKSTPTIHKRVFYDSQHRKSVCLTPRCVSYADLNFQSIMDIATQEFPGMPLDTLELSVGMCEDHVSVQLSERSS